MSGAACDVAVIGAGVVGLAVGSELAGRGHSVLLLERHERAGLETSSHNSEVIHAGLYYPEGSLKARSCVEGRERLYARCARDGVAHQKIGKLVVAVDEAEVAILEQLRDRALANGAGAVELIDADDVRRREPRVHAVAGLWSPESGIVDAHGLMDSYQAELEAAGGAVVLQTEVTGLDRTSAGWSLTTRDREGAVFTLTAGHVVNAAGLASDRIAGLAGLPVDELGWRLHLCKGDYFSLRPALGRPTRHLVYPVPAAAGLGVHVTIDLGGRVRLGPDAEYVATPDLRVDPDKAEAFARAASRYLPGLRAEHLQPEMAGLRPKLQGPGDGFRDFVVAESSAWGAPGMVHLVGIESPGLTAAGALARLAADLLEGRVARDAGQG